MSQYRYSLEKGSKKHPCPRCGKREFVRFVDNETGQYLPDKYGRCERIINCKYFENPYKDGYAYAKIQKEKKESNSKLSLPFVRKVKPLSPSFVPDEIFKATRCCYDQNVFIQNLLNRIPYPFDSADVEKVIALYHLGTIWEGNMNGSITFPYFERIDKIHGIQIIKYDINNHRSSINWIHRYEALLNRFNKDWVTYYEKNDLKVSCLFGAHLVKKYPKNPVAIVESAKSAVIGTLYYGLPQVNSKNYIWMGSYSRDALSVAKCKVLSGREVCFFPDLSKDGSTFKVWDKKRVEFQKALPSTRFKIVEAFEKKASHGDKNDGLDIADFLIRYDWRNFRSM